MIDLEELMSLEGAQAAFTFSDRGELIEHRIREQASITEEALDLLAHVLVANLSIATMQARGWEKMTGQEGFYPIETFTLVGFEWSAVAGRGAGVVLDNESADYERANALLAGSTA